MDLNLKALIGISYLIPIAITLRKIYAPNFDTPETISLVVAKIDQQRSQALDATQDADVRIPESVV